MLGTFARLGVGIVELMVLLWALASLAEVKRGQAEILRELGALKRSRGGD